MRQYGNNTCPLIIPVYTHAYTYTYIIFPKTDQGDVDFYNKQNGTLKIWCPVQGWPENPAQIFIFYKNVMVWKCVELQNFTFCS